MAAPKSKTITVTCPDCGHEQPEPKGAYSTVCKKCRSHIRIEETAAASKPALRKAPSAKKEATEAKKEATETKVPSEAASKIKRAKPSPAIEEPHIAKVQVTCFQCGTQLDVPAAAESTMCKRCSSHVDLRDYTISQTVSKNFRTHGKILLEEKGYILNTDSLVGDAIIKGRFIGKINAVRSLEIYSSAHIKGSFTTGNLILPPGEKLHWPEPLKIGGADISGELVANVQSTGTVRLRAAARVFGNIEAQNLVVENGAVLVGQIRIGKPPAPEKPVPKKAREVAA